MVLLAFDTATAAVSVAVCAADRVLASSHVVDPLRHAAVLAPSIEQVCTDAGVKPSHVTGIAVGTGPGPFTGLRAGLVTAHAWALAWDVPLYGVCTLDSLALQAVRAGVVTGSFIVATDARRREVYWAQYNQDGSARPKRVDDPQVGAAAVIPRAGRPVVGRGVDLYPEALGPRVGPADPDAVFVAAWAQLALADGEDLSDVSPQYLRRPDVHSGGGRKSVLG
ncbi:MAG: tRNA (adenosine(37)-N6)-threonylcarbamoyltransferase complex dimerization subunit type 1 TsaB [Actinomycetota bacterium]